jgi:HEAT repeat protein
MSLRHFNTRFRVRTLIASIAVVGVALALLREWLDPMLRWRRIVQDGSNPKRAQDALEDALLGRASGVSKQSAGEELIRLFEDEGSPAFARAVAVGYIPSFVGETVAIPIMLHASQYKEAKVRRMAVVHLGMTLSPAKLDDRIISVLTSALHDPARDVRRTAALILGFRARASSAIPVLVECLAVEESPHIQLETLQVLELLGASAHAALPRVRTIASKEPDPSYSMSPGEMRLNAARVLSALGDPQSAASTLRELETHESSTIRSAAAKLLSEIRLKDEPRVDVHGVPIGAANAQMEEASSP